MKRVFIFSGKTCASMVLTTRKSALLAACCAGLLESFSQDMNAAGSKVFQDDPASHALYMQMLETMRQAKTLSWVSEYRWEAQGRTIAHARYRIWLKKPNYARLEAMRAGNDEPNGILVGDGDYFWIYWPKEKPRYGWEESGEYAQEYEKFRRTFYIKERAPVGRHSIGHETDKLGAGMLLTIIDPSTFHGYTDSLQPYLDSVRAMGMEKVGDETCDVVEVSFMNHQRSWYIWVARKDHLPRRLKQIVRLSYDSVAEESWSEVTVNADIPNNRFKWSAPKGWKEWHMPALEEGLLKPRVPAPDFELASADVGKIKLSAFRGQIVWLNKWRVG
jgi:outer membrane lipoprotein-sorting protein